MDNCLCNKIIVETDEPINNLSVEPDNDSERTSFYNLDDQDWIGVVDSNGALIPSAKSMSIVFNGVEDIATNHLANKFRDDNRVVSVSFPDLKRLSYEGGLNSAFLNCTNLTTIYFPLVESVAKDGFRGCFGATGVSGVVSFPNLKTVGDYGFGSVFTDSKQITEFRCPELISVTDTCSFYMCFQACDNLTTVSFPKLKTIGERGFHQICTYCYNLKNVDLSSLEEVFYQGLRNAFSTSGVETISFPELCKVHEGALNGIFSANLGYGVDLPDTTEVFFPKLTADSFLDGGSVSYFANMFNNRVSPIVHFSADAEDFIRLLPETAGGFGCANTTILYDINPCYVEINVIGSQDYSIFVYGVQKISPFITGQSDKEYVVLSFPTHVIYFGMLTGLVVDETTSFTADLSEADKEICLTVPSGATLSVKYGDIDIPLISNGNGVYSFFSNGSGQEFSYEVGETQTTRASSGTFTLDGSSMSITITPTPKEWVEFVRPNLTADGTIGGDAFAVWSSGTYSTSASRQAWRAVDGNTSNSYYWYSKNETNPIYEFYNPVAIKLASLTFGWTNTSYCAKSFVLEVSNDGSSWTSLGSFNLTVAVSATATINCNTAYKYYRMTFTKQGTYLRLKELTMSATKYE